METIDDEDELLRRILEFHHDPVMGRIASSAFMRKKKLDPEMSVFLLRLSDPTAVLRAGLPRQRLVLLAASAPRSNGLDVEHPPTDQFYGHCVIVGFGQNWKEQCARLAEASRLVEMPVHPPE